MTSACISFSAPSLSPYSASTLQLLHPQHPQISSQNSSFLNLLPIPNSALCQTVSPILKLTIRRKMEFWKPNNVKAEQSATMTFYSYKIGSLFKLLEILSALILVLWSTTRLPIVVKLLVEFAKQLCVLLLSTPSVFVIGNAIVVALVGSFQSSSGLKTDLYDEFVEQSRLRTQAQRHEVELEKESEDDLTKQVVCSETEKMLSSDTSAATTVTENIGFPDVSKVRCYRRTQSETVVRSNVRRELRRSSTENGRVKTKLGAEKQIEVVDDLSSEEFRRTVEAFIAKQQRFLRDENRALVLSH